MASGRELGGINSDVFIYSGEKSKDVALPLDR